MGMHPDIEPIPRFKSLILPRSKKKLTLLCSPPGYGKTTALKFALETVKTKTLWLDLKEEHNQESVFFNSLEREMKKNFSCELNGKFLSQNQYSFLKLIESLTEDIYLVLDHYENIQSQIIHNGIEDLIKNAPDNLHIFICTWTPPTFALSKLRLRGQINEITSTHLALTPSETHDLLEKKTNKPLPIGFSDEVWKKTGGWIAVLCLLADILKQKSHLEVDFNLALSDLSTGYAFLNEEVLMKLTRTERDYVCHTFFLDPIPAELGNKLVNYPNPQHTIDNLINRQILRPAGNQTYQYHPLMAGLFQSRHFDFQPDELIKLNREAAEWYLARQEKQAALKYYLNAQDYPKAIEIFLEIGWDILQQDGYETVLKWCTQLERLTHQSPRELSEIKGFALLQRGDLEAAQTLLEKQLREEYASPHGMLASVMLARYQGRYEAVEQIAQKALSAISNSNDTVCAQIMLQVGIARLFMRQVHEAEKILSQALYKAEHSGNINLIRFITSALSAIYHNRGAYQKSIAMLKRSLGSADQSIEETFITYIRLAQLYLEIGELDKAQQHLKLSLELENKTASPEWRTYSYIIAARISRISGEIENALMYHRRAAAIAPKGSFMWQSNLNERMLLYLINDELSVLDCWAAERKLSPETAEYTGDEGYLVFARYKLHAEKFREAVTILEIIKDQARRNHWQHAELQALPWLAAAYQLSGSLPEAEKTFIEAVQLSTPEKYNLAFREIHQSFPDILNGLLCKAFQAGLETSHVRKIINANKDECEYEFSQPSHVHNEVTVSSPANCFEIQTFGGLRVFRNGAEIAQKGWRTERARDLLAFFAVHYDQPIQLDVIIEAFWPERPPQETRQLFHTNLHFLKRTLLHGNEKLDLFIHRSGYYMINLDHFRIDLQLFNQCLAKNTDREKRLKAAQLVKGPCLAGFYDDWALDIQNTYQYKAANNFFDLAKLYANENDFNIAVKFAENAWALEPLREDTAEFLIHSYIQLGNRSAAVRCYETLKSNLAEELGIKPKAEISAIIDNIRI
jgi:LuxR family maltose regulon positive regulatory protein